MKRKGFGDEPTKTSYARSAQLALERAETYTKTMPLAAGGASLTIWIAIVSAIVYAILEVADAIREKDRAETQSDKAAPPGHADH